MSRRIVLGLGLLLAACVAHPPSDSEEMDLAPASPAEARAMLWRAYEEAVQEAAVRRPDSAVPLQPLPPGPRVTVAHLTEHPAPAAPERPGRVSLPEELQGFCRGRPDPLLAMQQALGLPPQPQPSRSGRSWQVVLLEVPREALHRPCPGGVDESGPRCRAEPIQAPPPMAGFLAMQMWNAWRSGTARQDSRGRILGTPGYPFTGMGWAWNWDPEADSPVGVSEFILTDRGRVAVRATLAPEAFCAGAE